MDLMKNIFFYFHPNNKNAFQYDAYCLLIDSIS